MTKKIKNTPLIADEHRSLKREHTFNSVTSLYEKTFLDDAFQRRGGWERESGWSVVQCKKYLDSTFKKTYYNKIVVVDVAAALEYCQYNINIKECLESIEYFECVLSLGYKYISIDGNNSSSVISNFISKTDQDVLTTSDGRNFASFTDQERIEYLSRKIDYEIIQQITLKGMSDLFRLLNSSTNLNAHESRQARPTFLAKFVREYSNSFHIKYKDEFAKTSGQSTDNYYYNFLFTKLEQFDRRNHEELFASLCYYVEYNFSKDLGKSPLDEMYENLEDLTERTKKDILFVHETMKKISLKMKKMKNSISHAKFIFFARFIIELNKNFNIKSPHELFEVYLKQDASWENESIKMKKDTNISTEVYQQTAWRYFVEHFRMHHSTKLANDKIVDWFQNEKQNLLDQDIISYKRTNNDCFQENEKLAALSAQDFKDRNGNDLSVLGAYDGTLEGGHLKSFKDGGTTDFSNLEIMKKEDNRKLGSRSIEPYFEHQIKNL